MNGRSMVVVLMLVTRSSSRATPSYQAARPRPSPSAWAAPRPTSWSSPTTKTSFAT